MSIHFQENGTIYQQLTEYGIDQVLAREWAEGERVPSVRSLAAEAGVNPNTVMQAYRLLEERGIIVSQRGRGFSVAENGFTIATKLRRQDFIESTIPRLSQDLQLLSISSEELIKLLNNFQNNTK